MIRSMKPWLDVNMIDVGVEREGPGLSWAIISSDYIKAVLLVVLLVLLNCRDDRGYRV